jgi:hypothetical protein
MPELVCELKIRTCALSITQDLDIALRHQRSVDEVRVLWVNAVCTNQHNNSPKKTAQVVIMRSIFQGIRRVIRWLGVADDLSQNAFHGL